MRATLLLAAFGVACTSTPSNGIDLGSDMNFAAADLLPGAYPAGPYGSAIGDTVAPLVWEGYRNDRADAISTTKPFGPYSMDDLRRSGRVYAIIHISDFV